jgi:hypothetical protein
MNFFKSFVRSGIAQNQTPRKSWRSRALLGGIALCLGVAAPVIAANLQSLNQAFQNLLQPLNQLLPDGSTLVKSALVFNKLKIGPSAAEEVDAQFNYFRHGSLRDFILDVRATYDSAPRKKPKVAFDVKVNTDSFLQGISSMFGAENIFELSETDLRKLIDDMMNVEFQGLVGSQTAGAPDLKWDTQVTVNAAQKVEAFSLSISVTLDLAQIKDPVQLAEEKVESAKLMLKVSKSQTSARIQAVLNPQAAGFQEDQDGLKEMLEKIVAGDSETLSNIHWMANFIDQLATVITQ